MKSLILEQDTINRDMICQALKQYLCGKPLSKVLIVPPDSTRSHSGAGLITSLLYNLLASKGAAVRILPALGTHSPMTPAQLAAFFGNIPTECFLTHDWRNGVTLAGEIPALVVQDISEGQMEEPIPVEISNALLDPTYDLILSVGQVVPHEVAGMANYSKNILIGCGGSRFISCSHFLGACNGIERVLGVVDTPVRKLFDYAEEHFLSKLPLEYILTVTDTIDDKTNIIGLYIGGGRSSFQQACALSQKRNITYVDKPINTCVVWLNGDVFHSTWLGNKAIYRTRKALADGGRLIILAPGVRRFGEDVEIDRLIRKYGYTGHERMLSLCKIEKDLQNNMSAAAHLMHGSSDGRFEITYAAPLLGREAVESVGYKYEEFTELINRYNPQALLPGCNNLPCGDEVYFVQNPAVGLWDHI